MAEQSEVTLRLGGTGDFAAILEIYAPYVNETAITFETSVPSLDDFSARLAGFADTYPLIVAVRDETVAGYAYAHRIGERAAYAWNAELSVYLDSAFRGAGLGRTLCTALLSLLAAQGVRNAFSLITVPNDASIGLHEALGFSPMGIQRQAGFKCGAWHDVAWYQKQIGSFAGAPQPVIPLPALDASLVEAILRGEVPPRFDKAIG